MNVVVDMLPSDNWRNGVAFLSSTLGTCTTELPTLFLKTCFDGLRVTVLMLAVFNGY